MRSRLIGEALVVAGTVLVATTIASAAAAATPSEPAAFTLVQGLPDTSIDLVAGGEVIADDVAPGAIVALDDISGMRLGNLTVTSADGADELIGPIPAFDAPASGSWSLVTHLDDRGELTLTTFQNDLSAVPAGTARLTLRHTAQAGPVDLVIGGDRPIVNLASGMAASVELPAGDVADAHLATTGGTTIGDLEPMSLAADTTTIVYAIGSAGNGTVDFVVQVIAIPADAVAAPTTSTTEPSSASTATTTLGAATETTAVESLSPSAVNTGSPVGTTSVAMLALVAVGGLVVAGSAIAVRRRL